MGRKLTKSSLLYADSSLYWEVLPCLFWGGRGEKERRMEEREEGKSVAKRLCNEFMGRQAGTVISLPPLFHFMVPAHPSPLHLCLISDFYDFTWTALSALESFFTPSFCMENPSPPSPSSKRAFVITSPVSYVLPWALVLSPADLYRDTNYAGLNNCF